VRITGEGPPLVFFNGLGATQFCWNGVTRRLRDHYRAITFDFRGHGRATRARCSTFDAFLGDAQRVMEVFGASRPVIVAWSMGADLAIAHAAMHPNALAGIVVVDGAVPVPERLTEDPVRMRRSLNNPLLRLMMLVQRLTPYGYSLSGDQFADLTLEVDERRQQLLDVYGKVDCPITLILAERTAGTSGAHAERNNKLWRAGAERLTARYPAITVRWLNEGHLLPLRRPAELAQAIDEFCKRICHS
jgi:pimeloyl-ACP methyl ester carboxylesterase